MDSLSPTNPPSTPLEKIHHISTHLDTLLKELQTKPRDATPDKDTLQELVQYFRRQQTARIRILQHCPSTSMANYRC